MSKILIKRTSNSVDIITLVGGLLEGVHEEDHDTFYDMEVAKWKDRFGIEYVSHRLISDDTVPTDRYFRPAWCDETSAPIIDVDRVIAEEVHKDHLRALRAPILDALDTDFMQALETSDTDAQASIVEKKQALRAVTEDPAIASAETLDDLKAVIPAALTP